MAFDMVAFDMVGVDARAGDDFPTFDMAIKAAVMGTGMVMADLALCREALANGALVAPFPEMVCPSPRGGICLLAPRERWDEPKTREFGTWAAALAARKAREMSAGLPGVWAACGRTVRPGTRRRSLDRMRLSAPGPAP